MTGAPHRVAAGRVVVVLEDGDTLDPPLTPPVVPDTVLTAAARTAGRGPVVRSSVVALEDGGTGTWLACELAGLTRSPLAVRMNLTRALASLLDALVDADRRDRYTLAGPADGGVA